MGNVREVLREAAQKLLSASITWIVFTAGGGGSQVGLIQIRKHMCSVKSIKAQKMYSRPSLLRMHAAHLAATKD